MLTADNTHVRFTSPADSGEHAANEKLLFHYMHGSEELGRPFLYEVALLSSKKDLDPAALLGKTVGVELDLPDSPVQPIGGHRYFHGYMTHLAGLGMQSGEEEANRFEGPTKTYFPFGLTLKTWTEHVFSQCQLTQAKRSPRSGRRRSRRGEARARRRYAAAREISAALSSLRHGRPWSKK